MAAANAGIPILTATQILRRGLLLLRIDDQTQASRKRSTNVTYFKDHYGPHPLHAARVWRDLLTCNLTCPPAFINPAEADLDSFFYALHFLRCYPKERPASTRFQVCPETLRNKTWAYVMKIGALA